MDERVIKPSPESRQERKAASQLQPCQEDVSELLFSSSCSERRPRHHSRHFEQGTGMQHRTPLVISGCIKRFVFRGLLPVYFHVTSSTVRLLSSGKRSLSQAQQWTCWSVGEIMKKLEETSRNRETSSFFVHKLLEPFDSSQANGDQTRLVHKNHSSSLWIDAILPARPSSLSSRLVTRSDQQWNAGSSGGITKVTTVLLKELAALPRQRLSALTVRRAHGSHSSFLLQRSCQTQWWLLLTVPTNSTSLDTGK